jgi:pimeloyl-ACP methyl ester carboxylesterase
MNATTPAPVATSRWRRFVLGRFSWSRVILSCILIYLLIMVAGWILSDRLLFLPPPCSYHEGKVYSRVPVTGSQYIGMLALTNPAAPYVILYAHGNGEDIGPDLRSYLAEFLPRGFEVYAYDYRGYGISDGQPGYWRARADAEAAYQHLVHDRHIPPERIIVYGHSLGAALALQLAARHPVAGLVIESPFLTAFRVKTVVPVFPVDKFRNRDRIREIRCPVLVMHGVLDSSIPVWHGRELFRLAPEPKLGYWPPHGEHCNVRFSNPAAYWKQMDRFLELVKGAQKTQP